VPKIDGVLPAPEILRCPATGAELQQADGVLRSSDREYPVVDGVPILLAPELTIFSPEEVARREFVKPPSPIRDRLWRMKPQKGRPMGTAERYADFAARIRASAGRRVLVIGGGRLGYGAEALLESGLDIVESDVYLSPRVDLVCDAHHLPFADESFDGVVLQAVLEHVLDPPRVVAETHRVLRPGGLVYADTPFLQPVHEGAYDFTRWTELGHRRLFRMFEQIDRGPVLGPAAAVVWVLCSFARSLPRKRSKLGRALEGLTLLAFSWLPYFDRFLIRHPGATDVAAGTYFVGSKAAEPVSDQALLESYRGTVGRPVRRD
jgi:SAM-dependent methyltransferase/uncharacterized protein YbaR (Trm112 family)